MNNENPMNPSHQKNAGTQSAAANYLEQEQLQEEEQRADTTHNLVVQVYLSSSCSGVRSDL